MGYRFSLHHANWLAHLLQPSGATPSLEDSFEEDETLREFLQSFHNDFYPSPANVPYFRNLLDEALMRLDFNPAKPRLALSIVQDYFRAVPWIALLIPSQQDSWLSDEHLLRRIVGLRPEEPGVVLQLKAMQSNTRLDHVFPAFKIALAESTKWPGVLIWTPSKDAIFLPVRSEEETFWIFQQLARFPSIPDIAYLRRAYYSQFGYHKAASKPLQIVHLSDIHLGSKHANQKIGRIKALLARTFEELEDSGPILPLITGDLMDTPNEDNLLKVKDFLDFLTDKSSAEPTVVLGNHDMREDGYLRSLPSWAIDIPVSRMVWHEETGVGICCFNSARGGALARGKIGTTEFDQMGTSLDKFSKRANEYTLLAALHHHPIPLSKPSWYQESWYERLLGSKFEPTGILEDSEVFLRWCDLRRVKAILHGHKHIPRCDTHRPVCNHPHPCDRHECIAVIGCGSTVGKINTQDAHETFMSINIVTVDSQNRRLNCRLLAERIPGGGLESTETHEILFSNSI